MRAFTLYEQARELMAKGQYTEAADMFQRDIAANPHFKSLELLGECLIHLNRLRDAIVPLAAATTLNNGVRAPALLADVFLRLEAYHNAEALANLALGRSATNRQALAVKQAVEARQTSTEL